MEAFETGKLNISDRFSFDMQPIESNEDWINLKSDFLKNAHKFVQYVENLSDEQLDLPFVSTQYGTNNRNIEGVLEHGYYHLGQIRLIRKWLIGEI